MEPEKINLIVPEEFYKERIDIFLTGALEIDLSRSFIQKLIKNEYIKVNDRPIKQNYKLKIDDQITIELPEPENLEITPEDLPLDILYEDSSIAVINKAPGMVVHPGPGNWEKTLVNALLYHLDNISSIGGIIRPGIVHRLDKDTSGVMIIAKNDRTHKDLTDKFSNREVKKKYHAIVIGKPEASHEIINEPIGRHAKYRHKMTIREDGREAITEVTLKKMWNKYHTVFSLLEIKPRTGRTHQIRVHLSSRGIPIVGDPIYSKKWNRYKVPYLLLASTCIEFEHPEKKEIMKFDVPFPVHFEKFILNLEN